MHYANGREGAAGDQIVGLDITGRPIGGVVVDIFPEETSSNIGVIALGAGYIAPCTSINCLHIDDISAAGRSLNDREECVAHLVHAEHLLSDVISNPYVLEGAKEAIRSKAAELSKIIAPTPE